MRKLLRMLGELLGILGKADETPECVPCPLCRHVHKNATGLCFADTTETFYCCEDHGDRFVVCVCEGVATVARAEAVAR